MHFPLTTGRKQRSARYIAGTDSKSEIPRGKQAQSDRKHRQLGPTGWESPIKPPLSSHLRHHSQRTHHRKPSLNRTPQERRIPAAATHPQRGQQRRRGNLVS